jgi:hypothetical protein
MRPILDSQRRSRSAKYTPLERLADLSVVVVNERAVQSALPASSAAGTYTASMGRRWTKLWQTSVDPPPSRMYSRAIEDGSQVIVLLGLASLLQSVSVDPRVVEHGEYLEVC